ncbi:MAG: GNAT family N-acetyltransferase [Candidatus Eisenbacteria bacterium]|uniref:GNAT family N-acetyltransferase n=1 Tax=Eiseniibacteriota bacterium TaxID=2212470 RepID=A0A933W164_UNCEI|nr:GNAT family N-acetyltransferase [Candidatus Eisenbacteria bacterium]
MTFEVVLLEHREPAMSERIARLQREAYAVEADWLGVKDFPPARITAADVAAIDGRVFAAVRDGELLGTVTLERSREDARLVGALTVTPAHHRQGIGRSLVAHLVHECGGRELVVSTGVANAPAIALYRSFGFVEGTRRTVGAEPVEVVELRRPAGPGTLPPAH